MLILYFLLTDGYMLILYFQGCLADDELLNLLNAVGDTPETIPEVSIVLNRPGVAVEPKLLQLESCWNFQIMLPPTSSFKIKIFFFLGFGVGKGVSFAKCQS